MRVLIADDSRTERLILSTRLKKWGYDLLLAANGEEALKYMLAPDPPRLAILDWVMPGMTGPDVARIVRQKRQDQYIYMILVTALGTKNDIVKGLQAGADDYITKPVHSEELRVRLRSGARLVNAWTELERSEKRTRSIIHSAGDAILMISPNGSIQYVNPRAVTLSGVSDKELLGKSLFDFLSTEEDTSRVKKRLQELDSSDTEIARPQEVTFSREDGELATVLLRMVPFDFEGEQAISVFMTDLTEQKRLEIDLRHAQKMEAVGQLAAGIAHEINTPIQFISDSVTYLQDSCTDMTKLVGEYRKVISNLSPQGLPPQLSQQLAYAEEEADLEFQQEQVPKAFDRALSGLDRVAHIVQAMKEFARKDSSKMALADINHALESTLTVATNEYRYYADINLQLGELPKVHCNLGEVNQVFLNLIVNAAHAIEEANHGTQKRGTITISSISLPNDHVEIRIKDTGNGVPKAVQKRIFDPFYTTKEVGKGSGQGLAIAHTIIVDKHKGEITFETEEGVGTTFIVRLPINLSSES